MANPKIFQYLVKVEPLVAGQTGFTGQPTPAETVLPIRVPPRLDGAQVVAPFQPPVVTIFLDWDVQPPTPGPLPLRQIGWVATGPFQPGTDQTRLDWVAVSPTAPKLAGRPLTEGTIAPFQPAAAPTVFLDWQIEHPSQPAPPARADRQQAWAAPSWVPDVTTPAPILSWQGYQPAQVWPRVRPFPVALQPTGAASPTMFQSVPPAAVIAGQISVDYPEMPTNMSGGSMLGGFQ